MSDIKVKKSLPSHVSIPTSVMGGCGLSAKATCILMYLLSKPDGWVVRMANLEAQWTDGERSIRSGVAELEQAGYIHRFKINIGSKRSVDWRSVVSDIPMSDKEKIEIEKEMIADLQKEDPSIRPMGRTFQQKSMTTFCTDAPAHHAQRTMQTATIRISNPKKGKSKNSEPVRTENEDFEQAAIAGAGSLQSEPTAQQPTASEPDLAPALVDSEDSEESEVRFEDCFPELFQQTAVEASQNNESNRNRQNSLNPQKMVSTDSLSSSEPSSDVDLPDIQKVGSAQNELITITGFSAAIAENDNILIFGHEDETGKSSVVARLEIPKGSHDDFFDRWFEGQMFEMCGYWIDPPDDGLPF